MKNLIYYNSDKCDVYSKKISNKYAKSNKSKIYIKDINKFNVKNSVITFEVENFLIKPLDMPLDEHIHDRVVNSLKFYFNSSEEDVLYDYFLLDSDMENIRILLYAIKVVGEVKNILKYINKSYLVIRPLQFIMLEYLCYKYSLDSGIFLNNVDAERYNFIMFRNGLILINEYIYKRELVNLEKYINRKIIEVKEEFSVDLKKHVYFLNDERNKGIYNYKFPYDYIDYTLEEIITEHNYMKSKFSKFMKRKENYRKNA